MVLKGGGKWVRCAGDDLESENGDESCYPLFVVEWSSETSSEDGRVRELLLECDPTILGVVGGDDLWQD